MTDQKDNPIGDVTVLQVLPGYERKALTRSGPDGTFSFETIESELVIRASPEPRAGNEVGALAVRVSAPKHDVHLVVIRTALVHFDFGGVGGDDKVAVDARSNDGAWYAVVRDRGRAEMPLGTYEVWARSWTDDGMVAGKAGFTVVEDDRINWLYLNLSASTGMQLRVVNERKEPVVGVTVGATPITFVFREDLEYFADAQGHLEYRCGCEGDARNPSGVTRLDGTVELVPRSGDSASPLYSLSLGAGWTIPRTLMKLGDDPLTIVAVPR